jgi:multiple sugar transport system ATP-binding protein
MAEIVLDRLTKRFPDGTVAVDAATMTIRDGEFFILVGPSGCGKSTLLNMIVGLEDISDGELRVGGQRVNDLDPRHRNMAMVFQSYAIYPHMTVRQNMEVPLTIAKLPKEEIRRRVDEAAEVLELGPLLDRRPSALSGGQRQRVAMGRAIVREPDVFLMDEPLSNLDAKLRVQMRTEISRLQRRLGTTTVYVTHDQTEAMTLGDRVALLRRGVVQQVGTPRELYDQPANLFVAGFIGLPAMNFVPADVDDRRLRLPLGDGELVAELPATLADLLGGRTGRFVAGLRPEHLRPAADDPTRPSFEVRAEVSEWLGAEALVYFGLHSGAADGLGGLEQLAEAMETTLEGEAHWVVARLPGEERVAEGETVRLGVDLERLHLFDMSTGENLTRTLPTGDSTAS